MESLGFQFQFNFTPEFLAKIAKEGKDHRGEYGSYKYLGPEQNPDGKMSAICLISDRMIPVGVIYKLKVDDEYSIVYYKFMLDFPWKKNGETLTAPIFSTESYDHMKTKELTTTRAGKASKLMQQALELIIDLTEKELASKAAQDL